MPALRTQQQAIAADRQAIETAAVDQARYLRLSDTLTEFGARLRARAETLDITERQKIVRALIRDIRIGPDGITICHSLPVGRPDPAPTVPEPRPPAADPSGGGSPEWLLHVRGLHRVVRANFDVGRLEIAVNNPLLVCGFQRLGDLLRDRQRLIERNGALRDALRQILALDQIHHKRSDALALFESVDGRDIRMVQRGKGPGFASEPR